jgi:hypothetical protein
VAPIDNKDDVKVVVLQLIEVNEPHVPLYNCISGFVTLAPCPLIVTVCVVLVATNLYHTSLCTPAAAQPAGMPVLAVAFTNVPVVFEQLTAEVNVTAPAQSSFAGGGGTTVNVVVNNPLPCVAATSTLSAERYFNI